MNIIDRLRALGFAEAEIVNEARGLTTVRMRTTVGWVYERLRNADDAATWAARFTAPEAI